MPGTISGAIYHLSNFTNVPEDLVDVLKHYAKAAIRVQPVDLLEWSRDYFSMASETDSVFEMQNQPDNFKNATTENKLTPKLLGLLHRQLNTKSHVGREEITQRWTALGLLRQHLEDLLELMSMAVPEIQTESTIEWNRLVALAAGQLGDSLAETMEVLCRVLGSDGGSTIPVSTFLEMYSFLSQVDGDIPEEDVAKVTDYVNQVGEIQNGNINVYNLKSDLCPFLH